MTVSYDVNGDGVVNILDLILVAQHFGQSFASLSGVVKDSTTNLPLAGVSAVLAGNTVITDDGGNYSFANITPGTYSVTFSKAGYVTMTF